MKAAEVMSHPVTSVFPNTSVAEAVHLMLEHKISGLPVLGSNGCLVGIITEGDLLRRAETGTDPHRPRWIELLLSPGRLAVEYTHSHGSKVGEVMTPHVVSVGTETSLDDVVRLMDRHRIRRVPVVHENRVVGIISRADLLRALVRIMDRQAIGNTDDATIRDALLAVIDREAWAPKASTDVVVTDGVVDLRGVIFSEDQRGALLVAAEGIPGVKRIEDHLMLVEPMSGMVISGSEDEGTSTSPAR